MSVRLTPHEDLSGVVPGLPGAVDLADVWLVHALACLLDACEVDPEDRMALLESGADAFDPETTLFATDEATRVARLDACRRALAFSVLAVEARLNRVLRGCYAAEWQALLRLSPAERFRLAPRLLDRLGDTPRDAELCELVDEVFGVQEELVDAAGCVGATFPHQPSRFGPSRARKLVEASAEICCFLSDLAGEHDGPAPVVRDAARALETRVTHVTAAAAGTYSQWGWDWNGFGDFPPDVIGS